MIAVACGYIIEDLSDIDPQNNIMVSGLGYGKPPLEGESVNFSCPPKSMLIGPNSTTCMGNREWEPDPKEVACKGKVHGCMIIICYLQDFKQFSSDYV